MQMMKDKTGAWALRSPNKQKRVDQANKELAVLKKVETGLLNALEIEKDEKIKPENVKKDQETIRNLLLFLANEVNITYKTYALNTNLADWLTAEVQRIENGTDKNPDKQIENTVKILNAVRKRIKELKSTM